MTEFGAPLPIAVEEDAVETPLRIWRSESAHGGQVSYYDSRRLQLNQLASAANIQTHRIGRRRRMPGLKIGVAPAGTTAYRTAHGLSYFDDVVSGTSYARMVAHWSSVARLWNGSAWSSELTGLFDQASQMVQGSWLDGATQRAALFLAACTGSTLQAIHAIRHTSSAGTWDRTSIAQTARCLMWWQDRLWRGYEEYIDASDVGDGLTFSSSAIAVDRDCGDEIMALVPARGLEPYMLVFMRRRIYVFRAVWTASGLDFATSYLKAITYETGCLATRSAQPLGPMILFLAEDGVRAIMRAEDDALAGTREPISRPIHDVIETINWAYADRSCAAVFGGRYYLSVPTGANQIPSTVLVFDLATGGWNVWTAENIHGWDGLARGDLAAVPRLYGLAAQHVSESTLDACHLYYYNDDWAYEGSATEMTAEEIGPEVVFGVPEIDKIWVSIEIEAVNDSTSDSTLDIDGRVDEGTWLDIGTWTLSAATLTLPEVLPFTLAGATRTRAKYNLDGLLPRGRGVQFRIRETAHGEAHILGYTVAALPCPIQRG